MTPDDPDDAPPRHADELPSIQELRAWAGADRTDREPSLDDDEIRHQWRAIDRRRDPAWEYGTHALARGTTDAAFEAVPLQSLAETHRISFVVLDGAGKPFTKLAFVLVRRGQELERGQLGGDALVRRTDVTDEDYGLQLVDVDAVTWGAARVRVDEPTTLHVRTSGLDGQTLEVRIFEEFRERDDDVLATGEVTIQGGVGVMSWSAPADLLAGDDTHAASVSLVAEARDTAGHWAKTDVVLVLERPAIAEATWSTARVELGAEVELVAKTRGFAEGTEVSFDVWRVAWAGDDEHVETVGTVAQVGGRAAVTWTPEMAGEYWFSASVSADAVCSAASGLLVVG